MFQQAMIIAFTSDMIPRLVYYWSFSVYPYGEHTSQTMEGYIDNSLSVFNTSDFPSTSRPRGNFSSIGSCRFDSVFLRKYPQSEGSQSGLFLSPPPPRYRDFRFPPGHPRQYEFNMLYWHVIAAKMAFIIVVEVGRRSEDDCSESAS